MKFTDIFIRRPVLATVVSLMLLVIGLRSVELLPVLQYPRTQNAVVTVQTVYTGADANLVAGFITTPLENSIAQANGIDYMTSSSTPNVSTITANLRLNYDPDKALTEINTKVNAVLNQLPQGSQQPTLNVKIGQTTDAMYIGFASDELPPNKITDYLVRAVQPKLQAVEGVQTAEILGAKLFALRAWLDPVKLAAYGLTAADVRAALAANDFLSAVGNTKGQMVQQILTATTGLHSLDEFRKMVVKQQDGAVVRLEDVAKVTLGAEDYESAVGFDGKQAVYIGIQVAPAANLLDVIARVRDVFPGIQSQLPRGLEGTNRLRLDQVREQLHHRSGEDAGRGAADRNAGGVRFPRLGALGGDPDDCDSAVAHRHFRRDARGRLHHQPADAARAGIGDRPGGRRCDHRGGKRQPPPRGGPVADAGGDHRRARARQSDHCDDRGAGRRLRADRLPRRADRRAVYRIRVHAGRRGDDFGGGRAYAVADDVLAPAQTPRRRRSAASRRGWCWRSTAPSTGCTGATSGCCTAR